MKKKKPFTRPAASRRTDRDFSRIPGNFDNMQSSDIHVPYFHLSSIAEFSQYDDHIELEQIKTRKAVPP